MNIFGYLLQTSDVYDLDRKAFMGIGFGPEGVPLDIVQHHLLGKLLHDFSLLVVDEFGKFNGSDPQESKKLEEALDRLDDIYGETRRIRCSEFMDLHEYRNILERLEPTIEDNQELRRIAEKTVPVRYRNGNLEYPINEVACVFYLYEQGFRVKIGPEKEEKYDKLMKYLNENGKYGFRKVIEGMDFIYTIPAFSLMGNDVVPYVPSRSDERIFLGDSEDEIQEKLQDADEKVLRYLAIIGYVASGILGKSYDMEELQSSGKRRLQELTTTALINGIIRPYNGGQR